MAELEILSMFVLTPMRVEYRELNDGGKMERREAVVMVDAADERVFWPAGGQVANPLHDEIMKIVLPRKTPVKFFSEAEVAELIKKKAEAPNG